MPALVPTTFLLLLLPLAFYCACLWILWKFYGVLARIGEELGEIKAVLQQRLPAPERPDGH
jgi:hypothetical protein